MRSNKRSILFVLAVHRSFYISISISTLHTQHTTFIIQADPSSRVDFHLVNFTREFFSPGRHASSDYAYSFDISCLKHEYWAGLSSSKYTLLYSIWFLKLWRHSAILYQNVSTRIRACAYRNFPDRSIAFIWQNNHPGIRDLGHTKRDLG